MPSETVGDIEIYYERLGAGAPLLFISGTGSDLRMRPGIQDSPLARAFDMLAYDQRGLGQSSKPETPYSMAGYADDAAALMDHVRWASALVVGVSFGGMVAQELALRHPERVRRLVLACTSPGGAGGSSYPFLDIAHLSREDRARHLIPIADERRDTVWAGAHTDAHANLVALGAADPFADEPNHAEGARRQLEARAHHDTWDRLGAIACPTMIAAGAHDGIAPLATQRRLATTIRGARLQIFDGGHMFMIQDRTAVPAMIDFLKDPS